MGRSLRRHRPCRLCRSIARVYSGRGFCPPVLPCTSPCALVGASACCSVLHGYIGGEFFLVHVNASKPIYHDNAVILKRRLEDQSEQWYSWDTHCSYLHIQMRAIIVAVCGVAFVEDKVAAIVEGEPEEDRRAGREGKGIAPGSAA